MQPCSVQKTAFHMGNFYYKNDKNEWRYAGDTVASLGTQLSDNVSEVTQTDIIQYHADKLLGEGSYGKVYTVLEDTKLAVKDMTKEAEMPHQCMWHLMRLQYGDTATRTFKPGQKWTFYALQHPNFNTRSRILQEMDALSRWQGYSQLHQILHLERLDGGGTRLYSLLCDGDAASLQQNNRNELAIDSPQQYWQIFCEDLTSAVVYMHAMHTAHLDIKPQNILYRLGPRTRIDGSTPGDIRFLLTDYDFLTSADPNTTQVFRGGTSAFMPLAVRLNQNGHHIQVNLHCVDMYAVCVTLVSMLFVPQLQTFLFDYWHHRINASMRNVSYATVQQRALACIHVGDQHNLPLDEVEEFQRNLFAAILHLCGVHTR